MILYLLNLKMALKRLVVLDNVDFRDSSSDTCLQMQSKKMKVRKNRKKYTSGVIKRILPCRVRATSFLEQNNGSLALEV